MVKETRDQEEEQSLTLSTVNFLTCYEADLNRAMLRDGASLN